jgi:hypothetical protein
MFLQADSLIQSPQNDWLRMFVYIKEKHMKVTLKRNPDNQNEVEVHLDLGAKFRSFALDVFMYLLFTYLGMCLMRWYLLIHI